MTDRARLDKIKYKRDLCCTELSGHCSIHREEGELDAIARRALDERDALAREVRAWRAYADAAPAILDSRSFREDSDRRGHLKAERDNARAANEAAGIPGELKP